MSMRGRPQGLFMTSPFRPPRPGPDNRDWTPMSTRCNDCSWSVEHWAWEMEGRGERVRQAVLLLHTALEHPRLFRASTRKEPQAAIQEYLHVLRLTLGDAFNRQRIEALARYGTVRDG